MRYRGRVTALLGIVAALPSRWTGDGWRGGRSAFGPGIGSDARGRSNRPRTHPARWPRLISSENFNGPPGRLAQPPPVGLRHGNGGPTAGAIAGLKSYTSRPANAELNGHGDLAITARAEPHTRGPKG